MEHVKISIARDIFATEEMMTISVLRALERIRNGKSREIINNIRNVSHKGTRDDLKKKLPIVLFSGVFQKRKESALIMHSGFICLDFDDCDAPSKKIQLAESSYVFAAWISPSGNGVKALVRIPADQEKHREYFAGLTALFEGIDQSGKDVSRACFESFDPDIYVNKDATIFDKPIRSNPGLNGMIMPKVGLLSKNVIKEADDIVDRIKVWLEKTDAFVPGNRNNYILKFAGAMNRFGIQQVSARYYLSQYAEDDFPKTEIEGIIKSMYKDVAVHGTEVFESFELEDKSMEHSSIHESVCALEEQNPFPIDVFPSDVREIIEATRQHLSFPVDFSGASILFALSVSIGNTKKVRIKRGFEESAVLYIALVGSPGTNKSHPLSFFLKPIDEHDKRTHRAYEIERGEYERISRLKKEEQRLEGNEENIPPVWKKILLSDATMEKIADVHRENPRGLGVMNDELANWFGNFNRYNKGNDQSFWLSNWSSKPLRIDRKSSEGIFISHPFISVTGTIQTDILPDLFKENRSKNGFIDRVLFAFPPNLKKPYWTETEIDQNYIDHWAHIVDRLLSVPLTSNEDNGHSSTILQYSPEAKKILLEWQRKNTDQINQSEPSVAGALSKMDVYINRFALILELLKYACNESWKDCITVDSIHGAIKLAEYFKTTAKLVHKTINPGEAMHALPMDKQKLYDSLPNQFRTLEGVELAKQLGVPPRTFQYFIENRNLFDHLERGVYKKKCI